ncbi:hypothetical protein V6N13_078527 [Hibiscus sabdariffa]
MKNLAGKLRWKQLGVLTRLLDLNISLNSFFGELPVEIFTLTDLRTLDISGNNFFGQFLRGITGLRNLVHFDALSNSFSGSLSVEVYYDMQRKREEGE